MNAAAKIRWLLALICVSLFVTAIIAKKAYNPRNNLESSAKTLQTHLNQKEQLARGILDDKSTFNKLKTVDVKGNEAYALELIEQAKNDKIYISTYHNNQLAYWTGIRVLPDNAPQIKEGPSFITEPNGFYEAIKKTEGNFFAIIYIPVKANYVYQNQYLQNVFATELLHDNNIEIADINDRDVYAIRSLDNTYLTSVKLIANDLNELSAFVQILLWISGMLLLCALTNSMANIIANRGYVFASYALIAILIIAVRFINLYYHWPDSYQGLNLFAPSYYASNGVFPSLGDFVINVVLVTWLTVFIYNTRHLIVKKTVNNNTLSYVILVACIGFLIGLSAVLLNLFAGLVLNSRINFDVNNVLNFTAFSIIGVLLLCFGFLVFILFAETALAIVSKLDLPLRNKLIVFVGLIILTTIFEDIHHHYYTIFYLLWALIVIMRGYAVTYDKGRFGALTYIGIIIICSVISSIKLYAYQAVREHETRKILVQKLDAARDQTAEDLFGKIEVKVSKSRIVTDYFTRKTGDRNIKERFQKLYFDGYLTRYEFKTYEYDENGNPLFGVKESEFDLGTYKDMVLYSAFKVNPTQYFYRINNSFGFKKYFAIIPVNGADGKQLGTLVVDLKSKTQQSTEPFPELLIEGKAQDADELKGYSYAFYKDGKLVNHSGKYTYTDTPVDFTKARPREYIYQLTDENPVYSHLIYQPTKGHNLIVVSKEDNKVYGIITSLTFFFMVFLIYVFLLLGTEWLWKNYKNFDRIKSIRWNFWESFDKILYKTRIQLSMVFAVVVTLLIIGILTFISVSAQYQIQQDDFIHDKMARMSLAYNNYVAEKNMDPASEDAQLNFNAFADIYASDLTLFDANGVKLFTTQPKLYENGLIANRMNARAFINLSRKQKTGFINEEVIGNLKYKAAYAPVNIKNSIGYLQLPYFSNETDYRERIGAFLNTMINVYALVFIIIGIFAIAVARQITTPLTIIQQSLSNTIYGRKNEPIVWLHNDEIGSLIKEYNNMIAQLEISAQKLAKGERESAWREMAKQVAHEIKNPLTPLKLGLQLLEKSWKDKDPKFDIKFERFSASFVEQIDSLSKIASEFSDFAKMPETQIERFDVFGMITQAVTIFKQTENLTINYQRAPMPFFILADKDQVLRSFNNLLKNAIEAIPEDRAGVIDISYQVNPDQIFIKVKDNGKGIPEALTKRIFVPNFTTKTSGTGLGLALVKNAIEHSGGSISFDTEVGVGTTFHISFPVAED